MEQQSKTTLLTFIFVLLLYRKQTAFHFSGFKETTCVTTGCFMEGNGMITQPPSLLSSIAEGGCGL